MSQAAAQDRASSATSTVSFWPESGWRRGCCYLMVRAGVTLATAGVTLLPEAHPLRALIESVNLPMIATLRELPHWGVLPMRR